MKNSSSQTKEIIMGQEKRRLQEQVISILAEVTSLSKESVKKQKELKKLLGLNQRYLLIAYVEADMDIRFCKQEEDNLQTLDELIKLVLRKKEDK